MKKWIAVIGVYALVALAAWGGAIGADYDHQSDLLNEPPGGDFLLGSDHLGRDVLGRVLQGARVALAVGVVAAGIAVGLGTLFGVLAGWFGGRLDQTALWLSGVVAAVPGILLILAIGFMLGRGFTTVFLSIGLVTWVGVFRLVRAEVLKLRGNDFLIAARAAGARAPRILVRHLLPNVLPLVNVQFTLYFVYAVKTEVIISFLGVGMADEPSWGGMIAHAREDLPHGRWWPLAFATLAMFGLILAVQALGDRLRDRLDPQERGVTA